jgi:putative transcriptional regulator
MDLLKTRPARKLSTSIEGQFLVAMPSMDDDRFHRAVIYMCAHGRDGAMGFIINQQQPLGFTEIMAQLGLIDDDEERISLPLEMDDTIVRSGGPVDKSRGFVLHSRDYFGESSHEIDNGVCVTATVDILRAMTRGNGPRRSVLTLGYSGWGPGQLEDEILRNGWLTCPMSDRDLLFDADLDTKYDRVLAAIGIEPHRLSRMSGHA